MTEESGRLARWLRLLGYDAASAKGLTLSEVYRRAYNEGRMVLTRNRRISASHLVRVIQITSPTLEEQLAQLRRDAGLAIDEKQALTRCDVCNVPVQPLDKGQVKGRVPPFVYQTQEAFRTCPVCGRIYWTATHAQRIRKFLETAADA